MAKWVDYIPVKWSNDPLGIENNYDNNGFINVEVLPSFDGKVAFNDYIPVFVDNSALLPWSTDDNGYIPIGISKSNITIPSFFAASEQGVWYDPSDWSTLFQDSAGTAPVTAAGQPVGKMLDKSGRDNHASQGTATARPTFQTAPSRLTFDHVDDLYNFTSPVGGITGTMVLSTPEGTAAYGINFPAGAQTIGGIYFPGSALVGLIARNGTLADTQVNLAYTYYTGKGGGASGGQAYGTVTNFTGYWRGMKITSFPLLNTAAGTNFTATWYNCASLTGPFPLLNTAAGTNFSYAWYNCTSLTGPFPLINTAAGINFTATWYNCASLTGPFPALSFTAKVNGTAASTGFDSAWTNVPMSTFPANMFNACTTTRYLNAFAGCNALDQASIENIYVSIDASGVNAGTLTMPAHATTALMTAPAAAARTSLINKSWTVTPTA